MTTNTDLSAALAAAFPDAALKAERVREATRQWNEALAKAKDLIAAAASSLTDAEKSAIETGVLTIRGDWCEPSEERSKTILHYLDQCVMIAVVHFRTAI